MIAVGLDAETNNDQRQTQTILKNPDDEKEFISGNDSIERSRENNSNPRIGVYVAEVRTEMPQESSLENRLIHKASGSSA